MQHGQLDKGMTHVRSGAEREGERFHQAIQKGHNLKLTNGLFLEFSV